MREYFITSASLTELLQTMGKDVRTFFKQEIKLVKTEMSEKVSKLARDAMVLGLGNLMAGTGSILMLAGIAFLVAYAFQTTGLNPLLAMFLGFLIIGFLVMAVGGAISLKGIKALSKDSVAPLRTLHSVSGIEIETPNHTYAAGRVFGVEPPQVPGTLAPSQLSQVMPIQQIKFDLTDWGNQ